MSERRVESFAKTDLLAIFFPFTIARLFPAIAWAKVLLRVWRCSASPEPEPVDDIGIWENLAWRGSSGSCCWIFVVGYLVFLPHNIAYCIDEERKSIFTEILRLRLIFLIELNKCSVDPCLVSFSSPLVLFLRIPPRLLAPL